MTDDDIREAARLLASTWGPSLTEAALWDCAGDLLRPGERSLHWDRIWANYLLVRREYAMRYVR